jgi:arylsulfatase A-like enzyme
VYTVSAAPASKKPSFVIMMADDMGWGDWSRSGSPGRTPHLEEMSHADHAVWFHRAYSGNPICSPTRAAVMTGRTPARTCIYGVEQHTLCHAGVGGCSGSEYGLGNVTRDAGGYLSGFYGKW